MIALLLTIPSSLAANTSTGWFVQVPDIVYYDWAPGYSPPVDHQLDIQAAMAAWTGGIGLDQETFELSFCQVGDPCDVGDPGDTDDTGMPAATVPVLLIGWFPTEVEFDNACPVGNHAFGCVTWNKDQYGNLINLNINLDGSVSYGTGFPEETLAPTMGWVAAHELGHFVGFKHYDNKPSLMNSAFARGGDANHNYRVNTDEYIPLVGEHPGGGLLPNLMVYGFYRTGPGATAEIWQDFIDIGFASMDLGECLQGEDCCAHIHQDPYVVLNGLDPIDDVVARLYYTTSNEPADCSLGTPIAEKLVDLVPGVALKLEFSFTGEALGQFDNGMPIYADPYPFYQLCVVIDPFDTIEESSEVDNFFTSDYDLLQVSPYDYCAS